MVARSGPLTLTPIGLFTPVASMSMRFRIGGTQTFVRPGNLNGAVQFFDSGAPASCLGATLSAGAIAYRCLEHFKRRWIGRCLGPARFAEYAFNFRHGADETIGLLQQVAEACAADKPGKAVGI